MNEMIDYIKRQIEHYNGIIEEFEVEKLLLEQKLELFKERVEDYRSIVGMFGTGLKK